MLNALYFYACLRYNCRMKASVNLPLKAILVSSVVILFASSAWAQDDLLKTVSSLCQPEDVENVTCDDDPRECANKVHVAIGGFFENYEVPMPVSLPSLKYPQKCLHRSYQTEIVNLSYDVLPNGKPVKVRVLNGTNECFDRSARNYIRKLKFEKSSDGYSCIPWTLTFKRTNLTDSSGNSY